MNISAADLAKLEQCLSDQIWRLNNLYYIVNEIGQKVVFKLNKAQQQLFEQMHTQNLILKARQLGFTTFIDIFFLDCCLFGRNVEAGIIAHNREDASKIFRRKIQFPYENLNPAIKEHIPTTTQSKSEMEFSNGSVISVGTSMRSGTLNYLHISEFGKICAKFPEKAREIVSGSLETIHTETGAAKLFIESTAEGNSGYFFDYCQEAQALEQAGKPLTNMDFKFHFFPWWQDSRNSLSDPVPVPQPLLKYFEKIETEIGQTLTDQQRWWYVKKHNRLGDDLKREHPATPKEAFEQSIQGAYFPRQFVKARQDGRICRVPYMEGAAVDTWWDLGMNDVMAIWFTQTVGREIHLVDYYENSGEQFVFYAEKLREKQQQNGMVTYGSHNAPHDIGVRELGGTGVDRWESALKVGIRFNRIPRIKAKIDSINAARNLFPLCWFDEERCSLGIKRLENYRKKWNEHARCYENTPLHDDNSNGADAFQTLAMGHVLNTGSNTRSTQIQRTSAKGWT